MSVNTNRVTLRDDATGFSVTRTASGLTANRSVVEQNRDGIQAQIQDVQDAAADKASYYFDGTGDIIETSPDAKMALGTSDATLIVSCSSATINSASGRVVSAIRSGSNEFSIIQLPGTPILSIGTFTTNFNTGFLVPAVNTPFTIAVKRYLVGGVGKMTAYLNGVADVERNYTADNISTTGYFKAGYASSSSWYGNQYRHLLFNYALSEDKIRRYSAGAKLDWEDIGGALINTVTADQDFSSDTGWWTKDAGVTISGGVANFNVASDAMELCKIATFGVGKKYKLKFKVPTFTSGTIQIRTAVSTVISRTKNGVAQTTTNTITAAENTNNDVWEFVVTQVSNAKIGIASSSALVCTIDDFTITQLGCVLDLEPENITDQMWVDASPNGLHGSVTGAVANRFVPQYSTRNWIINGLMEFNQRGNVILDFAANGAGNGVYYPDRFLSAISLVTANKQYLSTSQPTDLSGSKSFKLIATSTATGYILIQQSIENPANLIGRVVTLSAWVKSNAQARLRAYWGDASKVLVQSASHPGNGAWARLSVTFLISNTITDTTANLNCQAGFYNNGSVSITSGDYVEVTGFMLNEGPVAAPFERAGGTIGGELALCQRYYEKSYNQSIASGGTGDGYIQFRAASTSVEYWVTYKTPKRASAIPVVYSAGTGTAGFIRDLVGTTDVAATYSATAENGFLMQKVTAGTDTYPYSFHWAASAEL